MTAVIYARYSSDSQREASIEGQLRDCKDYAERNGIAIVGTYIDRAYSAKTDDRPEFQRMVQDSARKIFDAVLVWKLDRFARNRYDAVFYKRQLEKSGVHLVSVMEPISDGPEGIMIESLLIGMAEYYSAELAIKVARGERENALKCKYNGRVVPLGYVIGKEDRLYHIDPETAPIVQEIFTRYADGEPAEKIAASLNERGLRTRTGKPFVKNSFFQIFKNRRYIGEYSYKDIVIPGGVPAIVDQALFDRVQERFAKNKITHGRPAKEAINYLLTTKLSCGKCGTLMGGESGTSHMGTTYHYYKCGKAKRKGQGHCSLKAIRKEPLERFVVDTAVKLILNDPVIEHLTDLILEAQSQENTRLPVLKEQLRDTEKRLSNLLEAIEQGILTPTTKQRLNELETRRDALKASILEEELQRPTLSREQILFWFEQFREGDVSSPVYQRQIIDNFVNSVYVFEDRVVLNFNFKENAKTVPLREVLGSSADGNGPPKQKPEAAGPGFCFARASQRRPRFESCTAAQARRCLRQKQPSWSRGSGLNFQAHCMRAGNSGHRNPNHQTRRIRTQFSTRKGSDTFFLCLKCCTTCTGQPQLYRATKRQSLRGRSLCLFVFCCRPLCKLTLKNSGFFSLSAPARFDWRFPAALLFIDPASPARAGGQPGRSPGRRRRGCPVRSDGRRHRRCGCWRRHPGCRA